MEIKQQDIQDHDGHEKSSTLKVVAMISLVVCLVRICMKIVQTKKTLIVSTLMELMTYEWKANTTVTLLTNTSQHLIFNSRCRRTVSAEALRQHCQSRAMLTVTDAETEGAA